MLQHSSEITGWLALFAAIVHYKELDAENAIAAVRGYHPFKIEMENITADKVRYIQEKGIDNLDKLVRDVRLSKSTVVKIYLLAEVMQDAKNSESIIRCRNTRNY